ncbi:MAG: UDP-N-acetylmuramate--L-alanine ligase [Firmicutes bacterium]|nr:UDP-N-acetylmuramate--L-alanine ligase [Bacillota bacterium]
MPSKLNLEQPKHAHFIGVGGISMSALAEVLLRRGWQVSGSDLCRSHITERLQAAGATVYYDHKASNVEGAQVVFYTPAIRPENPELQRARELNIPIYARGQLLGALMVEAKYGIAVSGTHGKTTTTSMISLILEAARLEATILVGGELDAIQGTMKIGSGDLFVAEACEYYDAFLDLRPSLGVILNIEADHHDYFSGIEHIKRSFRRFAELVPAAGNLVVYHDDPKVRDILPGLECNIVTFGLEEGNEWRAVNIKEHKGGSSCDILHQGEPVGHVTLHIPGKHHVKNALAAIAVGHLVGVDAATCIKGLEMYEGTHRRFDLLGEYNGAQLYDDYAHHPNEIKATLAAAKQFNAKRIISVFQPSTYTRTKHLLDDYLTAFGDSDMVVITDVFMAREVDTFGITSALVADLMKKHHPNVHYVGSLQDAAVYLSKELGPGDMVITMGIGDVYRTIHMLLGKEPMQAEPVEK